MRRECSHWCQWWLVWDHRTFLPSQPASPHHVPTHRLPLGASEPSLTRKTLEQETGMGSAPGGVRGQRQVWGQCSTHRGTVPALLTGLPSLAPRATLTLQREQVQGRRTGRDLPVPPQGLLTPKEGCPQQCYHPGLCSMGLPHWQQETYDRRPYLLWVPARPRLPARPVREKTGAISPHCLPGDACPTTVLSPSPVHHVVPGSVTLAAPLLSAERRTFAPLGPAGPRSPGKPIRLPSTTSACGQGAVRAGTQGTPGRSPQQHSPPQAPMPGDWMWSSIPGGAGWHLGIVPSSSHHLPWAPGALGGRANHPCPGVGRKIG